MEKFIIKPTGSLGATFFIAIFILIFGIFFTLFGIEYSKVQCSDNSCKVYVKYLGFIESAPKSIYGIESVFLDEKRTREKNKTTITYNVVLKNQDKQIDIFFSYSNVNKQEKKEVLEDLKRFVNKEVNSVDKTYGGLSAFFYIGFPILLLAIYLLISAMSEIFLPLHMRVDMVNKKIYVRNRNIVSEHEIAISDIRNTILINDAQGLKYRHPLMYKMKLEVKENFNVLVINLNTGKEIDIGGFSYDNETLTKIKNKIDSLTNPKN